MIQCREFFGGVHVASRSIKNRPSAKKKHPSIALLVIVTVFAAVILAGGVGVYALGSSWLQDLPDYEDADAFNTAMPSEVYASDDKTLLARFQLENREPVTLDEVSDYVKKGTVATEDERFYEHGGFDLWGIARALVVNITGSGREGASTITQQFVRNTILAEEMDDISLKRKVREMYLSVKLEERYSKDEILLMYLNTINYGSGAHGIQAASQRYFSKDATDLTIAEAATLIGIPQSPSYNNPIDNPDNCIARRNVVLERMESNNVITPQEHEAAKAEPLVLNPTVPSNDGIVMYPYFASYVRDLLTDPDGPYKYSVNEVFKGGLRITTTLDLTMQQQAEAAVAAKLETMPESIDGSLVAVDPATGHIKALVGGKDYYTSQVNLATGTGGGGGRPCGSSFKTFTLLAALEQGISPQTMVDCSSPANIQGYGIPLQNIDNINYGTRSIARAFAVSSNTGFVRLEMAVGVDKVADMARRLGITSPLSDEDPSLTLGTHNVTMLDMAGAYATIANAGVHHDPTPILRIVDSSGRVTDNSAPAGDQVISPEVAHAASEVMKGVVSSYEGTGTDAYLPSGQTVAAKTGTSSDYLDITFCGITPQLSVAIWLGDPENDTQVPEHTGAGDVFRNFVSEALQGQPLEDFPYASDPVYQSFSNSTYHVGGYYSSSSSSNSGSSDNDSNTTDKPTGSETPGTTDPSGGTDKPGETPGGNTNPGDTPGTTPGGSDTPGGNTGGEGSDPPNGGGTTPGGEGGSGGGGSGGGESGGGSGGGSGGTTPPAFVPAPEPTE